MGSGSSPPLTTVEWIPNESSPKNFKDKVRQLDPHTDTWQILNLELLEDIINIAKTVPLGGRLVKVPPSSTALASSAIHREHSLIHPPIDPRTYTRDSFSVNDSVASPSTAPFHHYQKHSP